MSHARAAIIADRYPSFVEEFFAELCDGDMDRVPGWAVRALGGVGVTLGV